MPSTPPSSTYVVSGEDEISLVQVVHVDVTEPDLPPAVIRHVDDGVRPLGGDDEILETGNVRISR